MRRSPFSEHRAPAVAAALALAAHAAIAGALPAPPQADAPRAARVIEVDVGVTTDERAVHEVRDVGPLPFHSARVAARARAPRPRAPDGEPRSPAADSTPPAGEPPGPAPREGNETAPRFVLPLDGVVSPAQGGASVPAPAVVADADRVFSDADVDEPARVIGPVLPAYPPTARSAGIEGEVALDVVVGGGGEVRRVRSRARAGYGLDEAAVSAVRASRFTPARRRGRPVAVRMTYTVFFRLD